MQLKKYKITSLSKKILECKKERSKDNKENQNDKNKKTKSRQTEDYKTLNIGYKTS